MAKEQDNRFSKNAPGPFYVGDGECITCLAPEHAAPDLIGFDEEANHCFFKKQPSTSEEYEHAMQAVWVSCCAAVRYSSDDPEVLYQIERAKDAFQKKVKPSFNAEQRMAKIAKEEANKGCWWTLWLR